MGISLVDGLLGGQLRVTTSSKERRDHMRTRVHGLETADDDYRRNIQVADLNALTASLAVIKWKKLFAFYRDLGSEFHSGYAIDLNSLTNDEQL